MSIYSQLTQTRVNAGRRPPRNSETKSLVSETDFAGHLLRGNVSPYSCGPTRTDCSRSQTDWSSKLNYMQTDCENQPESGCRWAQLVWIRLFAIGTLLWFYSYIKASLLSAYVNLHPCRSSDTVSGGISVSDLRLWMHTECKQLMWIYVHVGSNTFATDSNRFLWTLLIYQS